jgi:hypothetical protein
MTNFLLSLAASASPTASPSPSKLPTGYIPSNTLSPLEVGLVVLAIVLALLAGILGYRIIRGSRGL